MNEVHAKQATATRTRNLAREFGLVVHARMCGIGTIYYYVAVTVVTVLSPLLIKPDANSSCRRPVGPVTILSYFDTCSRFILFPLSY